MTGHLCVTAFSRPGFDLRHGGYRGSPRLPKYRGWIGGGFASRSRFTRSGSRAEDRRKAGTRCDHNASVFCSERQCPLTPSSYRPKMRLRKRTHAKPSSRCPSSKSCRGASRLNAHLLRVSRLVVRQRNAARPPVSRRTHHPPFPIASCRNLPLGAPDVLEEAVALGEPVQRIVALAHGADEAGQSIDDVLALDGTAVLVDLGDGELAGTVVLGLDDSARR